MLYFAERISENIARSAEGYLICRGVPVARTGAQDYLPSELGLPPDAGGVPGGFVTVFRPEEEVFSPATIASFEGKPVTEDHPPEGVTAENIGRWQRGHAQNLRRGTGKEAGLLLADLVITHPETVARVLAGKREISCGYTYALTREDGRWTQRDIRGNHIAVVDRGRAGPRVAIQDHQAERSMHMNNGNTNKGNHGKKPRAAVLRGLVASAVRAGDLAPAEMAEALELLEAVEQAEEPAVLSAEIQAELPQEAAAEAPAEAAEETREAAPDEDPRPDPDTACGDEGEAMPGAELLQVLRSMEGMLGRLLASLGMAEPAADADESEEALARKLEGLLSSPEAQAAGPAEFLEAAAEAAEGEPASPESIPDLANRIAEEVEADPEERETVDRAVITACRRLRPVLMKLPEPAAAEARREIFRAVENACANQGRHRNPYAALAGIARGRGQDADPQALGRRIMARCNANMKA